MKIDLHTHTKKCKSGDAPTREISSNDFHKILASTEVGIIAITNHNFFDLQQFNEIEVGLNGSLQVWPGIELDVVEKGVRGHLLVIASPSKAKRFSTAADKICKGSTPDNFETTIKEVLKEFDALEPLYVAHYEQKKPNIPDDVIDELIQGTANPRRVIKEVTNSISAGIYISHGHSSIYGSDVHDWSSYKENSRNLPDLRLPVESFDHFCLLLEKDPTTINTALNKKDTEELSLTPFEDDSNLAIRAYNDINIIFGPKGTGKSCILRAIAKHYSEKGIEACVYESASDKLDEIFDIKGRDLSLNLQSYGINYCKDEIERLKESAEVDVTSISKYLIYFRSKTTNKNAKQIKIKNIDPEEEGRPRRQFNEVNEAAKKVSTFRDFLVEDPTVEKVLSDDELSELQSRVNDLFDRLVDKEWTSFSGWKEVSLLNSAIAKFRTEVERKTGTPAKPVTTGFREYALNRLHIVSDATEILKSVGTEIPIEKEFIGNLGTSKGGLELRTEYKFQDGELSDPKFSRFRGVKKITQQKFCKKVCKVLKHAYKSDLFTHIAELNDISDIEQIETVYELMQFKRYFALEGVSYTPSSGEASMVMLQKELERNKDIYILDEPERSLGNEYISEVIVPLINERARAGKKVFISTHDANIAVRTLPYSSIYRCHGKDGYATYFGNPFSNNLVNLSDENDVMDWKYVSMKTLEGGEKAFGDRGRIYGNN